MRKNKISDQKLLWKFLHYINIKLILYRSSCFRIESVVNNYNADLLIIFSPLMSSDLETFFFVYRNPWELEFFPWIWKTRIEKAFMTNFDPAGIGIQENTLFYWIFKFKFQKLNIKKVPFQFSNSVAFLKIIYCTLVEIRKILYSKYKKAIPPSKIEFSAVNSLLLITSIHIAFHLSINSLKNIISCPRSCS